MKFRFPVVIIDEDFRSENISGSGIRALAEAIENEGAEVLGLTSYGDLTSFAQQSSRASCFILSIDDDELLPYVENVAVADGDTPELAAAIVALRAFVTEVRRRNADIPIFLYGETRTSRHLPNDILRELHGFIHMFEDTPEFVARHIIREAKVYLDSLAPPFFKELVQYAEEGSYSWHCPGHSGGVAFLKSPLGQMFHQFFGENMLRADVCNAVDELGQLLDHTGPVAASERNAARIFSADHLFFVTNGTSTSNKIVWHATVAPGDIVLVDRNCHKSILHAITMTGAIPVFLTPTRNHFGIIGPIPRDEFKPENIRKKIEANPFAREALAKNPNLKPRILTITQSTYDGVVYNVEMIKDMLGDCSTRCTSTKRGCRTPSSTSSIRTCTRSARAVRAPARWCSRRTRRTSCWRASRRRRRSSCRTAKNSTLRPPSLQRSVSDAHVDEPAVRDHRVVRRGRGDDGTAGRHGAGRGIDRRSARFPPRDAQGRRRIWRGLVLQGVGPGRSWPKKASATREDWMLKPNDALARLRPARAKASTCSTRSRRPSSRRGWTWTASSARPAFRPRSSRSIWPSTASSSRRPGLYSFFIMFTIGITKGRWNSMVTELQQFKDDYDNNQPLWRVLPEFVAQHPTYERVGLRDLCEQIHSVYRANDIARLTTEMYLSSMEPAMKPSDAFAKLAHREIDRVPIDELEGRVTAILLTPYPPGIPLLIPGERFNRTIVDYLRFAREFNERFPGFHTDIHGLVGEMINGRIEYFVDCVRS